MTDEEKAALEFYANSKNYHLETTSLGKFPSKIDRDGGVRARKVLRNLDKESLPKYPCLELDPRSVVFDAEMERKLNGR